MISFTDAPADIYATRHCVKIENFQDDTLAVLIMKQ